MGPEDPEPVIVKVPLPNTVYTTQVSQCLTFTQYFCIKVNPPCRKKNDCNLTRGCLFQSC